MSKCLRKVLPQGYTVLQSGACSTVEVFKAVEGEGFIRE